MSLAVFALGGLLVACSGASSTPLADTTAQRDSAPTAPPPSVEPAQRTREPLVTPQRLDREFADSATLRERRDALVNRFVDPVVNDARVVAALRAVPRHSFVPQDVLDLAYIDSPLPLGFGQTISQPSLVAMMTDLLQLEPGDKVLEIGTGSGYQAAILGELVDAVYSVEIIPELAGIGRAVLDALGYMHVTVSRHDGYLGWEEHAPFDAIIVTAAPDHLPSTLVAQLNPDGGRMVIPIGPVGNVQTLWLVTRDGDEVDMERLLDVRFVPLTRGSEPVESPADITPPR